MCGAASAGADPAPWSLFGERLGAAYQVADDLVDAVGAPEHVGKPTGRDRALKRPSQATNLGVKGARAHMETLVSEAFAAIPPCGNARPLEDFVRAHATRLAPKPLVRDAA
jgi:geranylgeranyl diphosphate synthase type II